MSSQTGVTPLVVILVVVVLAIVGAGGYLVLSQRGTTPAATPSLPGVPRAETPTATPTAAGFPYAGLWEIKPTVLVLEGPGKWKETPAASPNRFVEIQPQGQICGKPSVDAPCDPADTHAGRIDGNTLSFPGKIGDTPVNFRYTFTRAGETLEIVVTSDYRVPGGELRPFKMILAPVR